MHMRDPLSPTLMTRLRAKIGGQRDAAVLEVMRRAGKAAYDERLNADQVRSELIAAGTSPWSVPVGTSSQLVAAWNAFVWPASDARWNTLFTADAEARLEAIAEDKLLPFTFDKARRKRILDRRFPNP